MRLIDADALLKHTVAIPSIALVVYKSYITNAPTIDAVPVVRCKDCKFYRFYDGTFGKGWMCFENNTARHGDDYCSRGERKENV